MIDGLLRIEYIGGIGRVGFHHLDQTALRLRRLAPVTMERMDQALVTLGDVVVCDAGWPPGTPPSAVIVRDDQYQFASRFAAQLADRGILRAVYRQQHWQRALRFCQLHQVAG